MYHLPLEIYEHHQSGKREKRKKKAHHIESSSLPTPRPAEEREPSGLVACLLSVGKSPKNDH